MTKKNRNYKVETARRRAKRIDEAKRQKTDRELAALQPHRRCLPVEKRLDPLADSYIGRLYLASGKHHGENQITYELLQGALMFKADFNSYRASIGSIDPDQKPAPGWGNDISPQEARRRRIRLDEVHAAMMSSRWGQKAARQTSQVVIWSKPCENMSFLICGLQALARYYRLTGNRKSANAYIRSSTTAVVEQTLAPA
jgi:hypothetical protein